MASQTTNLKLKKPSADDFYSVEDQNGNMDIIDQAIKKDRDDMSTLGKKVDQQKTDLEKKINDTIDEFAKEVGEIKYNASTEELQIPANFQHYDSSKEELIISII